MVVSADYRLPSERRWVLTAPIVSALDVDTPVAVRLQPGDPVKGFIRADEVTRTYVPWLTDRVGMITVATLDALAELHVHISRLRSPPFGTEWRF